MEFFTLHRPALSIDKYGCQARNEFICGNGTKSIAGFANPQNRQLGFSLIEILIASLVFVVGLVGLINLQTRIVGYQRTALIRTDVAGMTSMIAEMLRSNPNAVYDDSFYSPANGGSADSPSPPAACSSACTPDQVRDNDLNRLRSIFSATDAQAGFARGNAGYVISRLDPPSGASTVSLPKRMYQLVLFWPEKTANTTFSTDSNFAGAARYTCPPSVQQLTRVMNNANNQIECVIARVDVGAQYLPIP